ncbi:MAG: replicative DNA helicase [Bacteroidetes bacterium]|nr:replicative DNA helicase [Bacteroidota bacterium]
MAEGAGSIREQVDQLLKKSSRKGTADLALGKVQPQAIDLEEAVLGAIMLEQDALSNVIDILKPDSFYGSSHQLIFGSIQRLFEKGKPVDILTVTEELRESGELDIVGGSYYVTQLSNKVSSAAHVEHHAHIISQKHIQRELIRISTEVIKDAYEDTTDVFELLDKAEKNLYAITDSNLRRNYDKAHTLVSKAIKQIESMREHGGGLVGVPSGFVELDRLTSGWQKSDLIVIAGRPGMGKTSFVLSSAATSAIRFKKPVAIFSLEMSALQLVNRLMGGEAELPIDKFKKGDLAPHEWQQLNSRIGPLSDAPIFIDDTPAINIFELRAKARRLKSKHNIELLVIDYLQLMSGTGNNQGYNREQEISNITRQLKNIAKEMEIPIIAISQLSRAVETRGGTKKPQLSDLRESGAIEQDADMVIFIYRPEYYGITEDEDGNSMRGIAEISIAKHRNGALANIPVRFIAKYAKFVDLDPNDINLDSDSIHTKLPDPDKGTITRGSKMNGPDEGKTPF